MTRIKLALLAVAFLAVVSIPLWTSVGDGEGGSVQSLCPVMGFDINRDIFTDYHSKRIYFCCPFCPSEFKKTPDKFMDQMQEKKVLLEDAPA
jgi:YHS domain-containing protein